MSPIESTVEVGLSPIRRVWLSSFLLILVWPGSCGNAQRPPPSSAPRPQRPPRCLAERLQPVHTATRPHARRGSTRARQRLRIVNQPRPEHRGGGRRRWRDFTPRRAHSPMRSTARIHRGLHRPPHCAPWPLILPRSIAAAIQPVALLQT